MDSVASKCKVVLRNQSFNVVAVFDSWEHLSYKKQVNGIGSYSFKISGDDQRRFLFELDGTVQILRSLPGLGIDFYEEFLGFHRKKSRDVSNKGVVTFESSGVGLNDLLARTGINYPAATVKAYKYIQSESAMKEYVEENCGSSATISNGRVVSGVLPNFRVEPTTGFGIIWEGDRSYTNLLDVLSDIAKFSSIDFEVYFDWITNEFVFQTYTDQLGEDRTMVGLDPTTGLNGAGNFPILFSLDRGNISTLNNTYDRTSEHNVITVLGSGDESTREKVVRYKPSVLDSPWNRIEISRSKDGFESEMETFGDGVLNDEAPKKVVTFTPLMQPSCCYGKHFFMGDKITMVDDGESITMRIVEIGNDVKSSIDNLSITFSDINT